MINGRLLECVLTLTCARCKTESVFREEALVGSDERLAADAFLQTEGIGFITERLLAMADRIEKA